MSKCNIAEQIIDDCPASGLKITFINYKDGMSKMILEGENLPFGNREFVFGQSGKLGATGTATRPFCLRLVRYEEEAATETTEA